MKRLKGFFNLDTPEFMRMMAITAVACLGGAAKYSRMRHGGKHRLVHFVGSLFVAGFVGMQAHFLMEWLEVDLALQFAIAGAAGYSGNAMLDIAVLVLKEFIYKKTGLDADTSPQEHEHEDNDKHTKA